MHRVIETPAVKTGCDTAAWRGKSCKAHGTFPDEASQAAFKSKCFPFWTMNKEKLKTRK